MKNIYILAPYPSVETLKDGMVQRIASMDELMKDHKRTYINIAFKNQVYKSIKHADRIEELFFNPFYPILIIRKFLLRADVTYAHSIHFFRFMPYCFLWLKKRRINLILDAHGVVPEEIKMYGKRLQSNYLNWIEKKVFAVLAHCICVSDEMAKHYRGKYPKSLAKYHVLFTGTLMPKPKGAEVTKLAETLKIKEADCVIMYCGNAQIWQNIPLMIQNIQKIKRANIKFIILTGETGKFNAMLLAAGLDTTNIILKSVEPSELNNYYELAHYGFILRNDILINRVSNPTKMLEYLQFGLIPIILSPFIGDYYSLGYEYISISGIENFDFITAKSLKNIQIAQAISSGNKSFDIKELIS